MAPPPLTTPALGQPTFAAPTGVPVGGAPTQPLTPSPAPDKAAPGGSKKSLSIAVAAVAAVAAVGIGLLVWKFTSGDDVATAPATTISVVTTTPQPTTIVETTVETTVVETTVETTTATTVVDTTVPTTEPPVTEPPRPLWSAPPVPEPPVFTGSGVAGPVSDPLAGGSTADQATPYLQFAQTVFDLMAADDWAGVQPYLYFLLPDGQVVPYTFDLQSQWPSADRLSLLLVDAKPDPSGLSGYDLTVAVVANFPDSTSILCGHLYSDPNNYREVIQRGQFPLVADGLPPTMPETLLNDPAQLESLKASCK